MTKKQNNRTNNYRIVEIKPSIKIKIFGNPELLINNEDQIIQIIWLVI